jgi:hypothetical protein
LSNSATLWLRAFLLMFIFAVNGPQAIPRTRRRYVAGAGALLGLKPNYALIKSVLNPAWRRRKFNIY